MDPLELIFRKSDVKWGDSSRGWEISLSYTVNSRVTSAYIKGTVSAKIQTVVEQLKSCSTPVTHPFLLPILMLRQELSLENDNMQREVRAKIRMLENALVKRYKFGGGATYGSEDDLTLDAINHILADSQARVLWKRPQAWQNSVRRMREAMVSFWEHLPDKDKRQELEKLHLDLLSCLDYVKVKLEGLEHYSYVSLERLNMLREIVSMHKQLSCIFLSHI